MVGGGRSAHCEPMDTAHETRTPGAPRPALGGLTRANDDTVISGLCGGLGRHFGIDPLVFRIAFVVMSLAGGTGILLYLVGWALVPDDNGATFGARWLPGKDRGHKLFAAALAGIGLLLLLDRITDGHGDDVPLGLVLIGVGGAVLWSRRNGQPPTPTLTTPTPTPTGTDPGSGAGAYVAPEEPVTPADEPGESTTSDSTTPDIIDIDPTTPLLAGSSSSWP
ncbi:MAG: hypothetical protein QOE93_1955, partial [Actinomycetota bacterium]|nr:hypothetical protein [Actinomycetota bacterium]